MIDRLKLNAADYTVVNVEAPEMVASICSVTSSGEPSRKRSRIGVSSRE